MADSIAELYQDFDSTIKAAEESMARIRRHTTLPT